MIKRIISFNSGGLGNRIRPLVSILRLTKFLEREPLICWPINNHCHCSFDELFDFSIKQILPYELDKQKSVYVYENKYFGFAGPSKICAVSNRHEEYMIIKDCYKWILYEGELPYETVCTSYEEEWNLLPKSVRKDLIRHLNGLKPKADIRNKVKSFKSDLDWDEFIIGVQIRRKDKKILNKSAYTKSSDQAFIREMEFLIKQHRKVRFFIASDCLDTIELFEKLFGEKVIYYRKTAYDSIDNDGTIWRPKEAVREALVELLILADTQMILGSHESTFSCLAPCFKDRPLKIVSK